MKVKVVSLKDSGNEDLALNNCIYMSSKLTRNPNSAVNVKIGNKILKCMFSTDLEVDRMAASKNIREYLGIERDQEIIVDKYDVPESNQPILADLQLNISLIKPKNQSIKDFNSQKAIYTIRKMQIGFFFNINENKYFKLNDKTYSAKVIATNLAMSKDIKINSKNVSGRLQEATQIKIILPQTPSGKIKQPKSKKQENQGALLFKPGFNVQDLGIGGLDEELFNIFRRIFSSRRFSQDAIKRFGIKHVKGIILYGPPGTGKTLIAKKLAQCLNVKDLKIVNGPEIFSKFMGQSEQNIRKLFIEARQDEKRLGDKSELHIIVFDEIDAICKQRGMGGSTGSQVSDQVVNQLLTNIDGVDSLNNIIVIGMTNRKDLLDQAILRPGRFEVHIQVSLPNKVGRQQIFNIHTQTLRKNKLLMKNCQIQELARLTKNYTGAQIQGLVKCASSYSISRTTNILDFEKQLVIDESKLGVEMQDFLKALDEVKPQFGVDEETFNSYLNFKIINYGGSFDFITDNLRQSALMKNDESSQIKSILLRGPNGTGKTTHTISFSKSANFSYVKLISAQNYIGMSDSQKVHAIQKVFEDSYKTQQACIIVDNLQSIVQYSNIGRKFSNDVLQTLLILIGRIPPSSSCKLLIIGTTAYYDELSQLGLLSRFDHKIEIPVLQSPEIKNLLIDKFAMSVQSSSKIAELLKGSSIRTVIQLAQLVSSRQDIQQWQFYWTTLIKPPKGNTITMI